MGNCTDLSNCYLFADEIKLAKQKEIQNQTSVHQSQYLDNVTMLNNTINNTNEGVKYSSYQRYLNKRKGNIITNQGSLIETPVIGNKSRSFSLSSKTKSTSKCLTFLGNKECK